MIQILRSLLWIAIVSLPLFPQARASGVEYELDSSRTSVAFEVRTLGASQRGTVTHATGTVSVDGALASGSLDVRLDARTLDADTAGLRRLLRGENLLAVERYPEIAYRAKRVALSYGQLRTVDGELTLRGITRRVPLIVTACDCASFDEARAPCHLTATGIFRRSEFGMTKYLAFASDEVKLVVTAVALPVAEH